MWSMSSFGIMRCEFTQGLNLLCGIVEPSVVPMVQVLVVSSVDTLVICVDRSWGSPWPLVVAWAAVCASLKVIQCAVACVLSYGLLSTSDAA